MRHRQEDSQGELGSIRGALNNVTFVERLGMTQDCKTSLLGQQHVIIKNRMATKRCRFLLLPHLSNRDGPSGFYLVVIVD